MKKIIFIITIVLIVGVGGYFIIKGDNKKTGSGFPPPSDQNIPSASQQPLASQGVNIKNFSFEPNVLTIKVDTEVTWTNEDSTPHQIALFLDEKSRVESKILGQGDKYSLTFREKREYDYYCGVYPQMKGKIIVTE